MKTIVPIALMVGLTCPCKVLRMRTGTVSLSPETNQATANSSKDTAMVTNSAAKMLGAVNGRITWRIAFH
ncbi:hypothetical protein D3C86_2036390 [compost metagenome]